MKILFLVLLLATQACGIIGASSSQPSATAALAPAELRLQRFQQFMAIATDRANLGQSPDSVKPSFVSELADLKNSPLESFSVEAWQAIVDRIPTVMNTANGIGGITKFGNAITFIKENLQSLPTAAHPPVSSSQLTASLQHVTAAALAPAALRAQRVQQFMTIATTDKNLDQTFASLEPYISDELAKLKNFPLESLSVEAWQMILENIPAAMATGASGPARLGKALALIEDRLKSLTTTAQPAAKTVPELTELRKQRILMLEPSISALPADQQQSAFKKWSNISDDELYYRAAHK